jgi:hypothetical protein
MISDAGALRVVAMNTTTHLSRRLTSIHVAAALAAIVPHAAQAAASVGLSTLHSRLLSNPTVAEWFPQAGDNFADVVATGDFNGDGADDLAVGIPNDDGRHGIAINSGIVVVWYGIPGTGLAQGSFTVLRLAIPQEHARFGAALAAGDFDHDGFDDLAVGVPDFDGVPASPHNQDIGKVAVHFGSPGGLEDIGSMTVTSRNWGDSGQRFGTSLAVGDFNGDLYDDLAVGAPNYALDKGIVYVQHGPDLDDTPDWYWIAQMHAEIPDEMEEHDLFGFALAAGNFNSDAICGGGGCAQYDDLVIGVPGEDSEGKVLVLFGSQWSLLFGSAHWFGQGDIGGTASPALFGRTLAVGDFDGDLDDDLAIGAPTKSVNGQNAAGQVTVLFGSLNPVNGWWFDVAATRWLTQTTFYGAAANAAGDFFGWSLGSGDFDRDGRDDLAVGHIGEDIVPGGTQLGGFTVLTGSSANPRGPGRTFRFFGAGYAGMPIPWANGDQFGWSLATGDFDGDLHDDLVVGTPFADAAGVGGEVGSAALLHGSLFADGFEWDGSLLFWSEVVP